MLKTASPVKKLAGTAVFCAADKDQVATWYPEKRHSLFSYFFLNGLQGAADKNRDKIILLDEMKAYLEKEVRYWARRNSNRIQSPLVTGEGWDIDQGNSTVLKVANVMAELFNWDQQRKEKEIQLFHQYIKETYQVQ